MEEVLNLARITMLALADSVNPCAIAVLTMVLVTIMAEHPEKRHKVLMGGFSFVLSVFIAYLFYGLVLVQFFTGFTEFMRSNSIYIYDGLAILSMIIGGLNIKDYFIYRPGGIATEMPLWMRPIAKRFIKDITSAWGAFVIGFVVSIFLLPCTMGPYIVASGLLSTIGILKAIPWLVYYNILFVLPMIFVVGLVFLGFFVVGEVSDWKERNIRRLHLIAGILLFLVGFGLLMGWL